MSVYSVFEDFITMDDKRLNEEGLQMTTRDWFSFLKLENFDDALEEMVNSVYGWYVTKNDEPKENEVNAIFEVIRMYCKNWLWFAYHKFED